MSIDTTDSYNESSGNQLDSLVDGPGMQSYRLGKINEFHVNLPPQFLQAGTILVFVFPIKINKTE